MHSAVATNFSPQQGSLISSILPGPELPCSIHSSCTSYEICAPLARCEFAYHRDYTVYVDGAEILTSFDVGSDPDVFAEWSINGSQFTTPVVNNDTTPYWYVSATSVSMLPTTKWTDVPPARGCIDELLGNEDIRAAVPDIGMPAHFCNNRASLNQSFAEQT